MRILFFLTIMTLLPMLAFGQDTRLAQQYYQDGEFEKAAVLYKKLYEENKRIDNYFDLYIRCLLAIEKFDEVEAAVKQGLKEDPNNIRLYVTYGDLYERQFKETEAQEQYLKAIKKMPPDQQVITNLAGAFTNSNKIDLAIEAYEVGGKLIKDEQLFAFNLAELYKRKGDTPKMVANYLLSIEAYPQRINMVKSQLQRNLSTDEDYTELQTQLYAKVQKDPDAFEYLEMLQWVFVQKKDYKNAFRQAKALDKRLGENGARVYQLAQTAFLDKDYDAAITAYDYLVEDQGLTSPFYLDAKRESLRARRKKLVEGFSYNEVELREVEKAYEDFLNEFGRNKTTASIIAELADLEAFYLKDLPKAIALLDEMINYPAIEPASKHRES